MNHTLPSCTTCGGTLLHDLEAPGWASCLLCGRSLLLSPAQTLPPGPSDILSQMLQADARLLDPGARN